MMTPVSAAAIPQTAIPSQRSKSSAPPDEALVSGAPPAEKVEPAFDQVFLSSVPMDLPQRTPIEAQALHSAQENASTGAEQKAIPQRALQLSREAALASVPVSGEPWNSNWVFGGKQPGMVQELLKQGTEGKMPSRLDSEALQRLEGSELQAEIKGLLAQAKAAAEGTQSQDASAPVPAGVRLSGLQEQLATTGGTVEAVALSGVASEASPRTVSAERGATPQTWSGADFLMAAGATNAATARGDQQSASSGQGSFASSGGFSPASEKSPIRKGEIDPMKGRPLTPFEQQIAAASTGPRPETIAPVSLTGHVVQGAMARERLSSQSLASLSESIRGAQVQGGGNIKIRLNPDHLGEIRLEVATVGNRVGLKIQASDTKAKNVIEESIKYLRESLGTHDLSLAKVDVTVAPARANTDSAFSMDQRGNESGAWNAYQQQSDLRQGGRQAYGSREDSAPWSDRGSVRGLTQAQQGSTQARTAAVGRVDVMA